MVGWCVWCFFFTSFMTSVLSIATCTAMSSLRNKFNLRMLNTFCILVPGIVQAELPEHLGYCVWPKPGANWFPAKYYPTCWSRHYHVWFDACIKPKKPVNTFSHEGYLVYGVLSRLYISKPGWQCWSEKLWSIAKFLTCPSPPDNHHFVDPSPTSIHCLTWKENVYI